MGHSSQLFAVAVGTQVATRTLLHAGLTQEAIDAKLQQCMDAMTRYAVANGHTAGDGLVVLPGIVDLLEVPKRISINLPSI